MEPTTVRSVPKPRERKGTRKRGGTRPEAWRTWPMMRVRGSNDAPALQRGRSERLDAWDGIIAILDLYDSRPDTYWFRGFGVTPEAVAELRNEAPILAGVAFNVAPHMAPRLRKVGSRAEGFTVERWSTKQGWQPAKRAGVDTVDHRPFRLDKGADGNLYRVAVDVRAVPVGMEFRGTVQRVQAPKGVPWCAPQPTPQASPEACEGFRKYVEPVGALPLVEPSVPMHGAALAPAELRAALDVENIRASVKATVAVQAERRAELVDGAAKRRAALAGRAHKRTMTPPVEVVKAWSITKP